MKYNKKTARSEVGILLKSINQIFGLFLIANRCSNVCNFMYNVLLSKDLSPRSRPLFCVLALFANVSTRSLGL